MGFVIHFESIKLAKSLSEPNRTNTKAIIPVSLRGAKKIPSLCSEQAVRSRLYRMRLPRCARNGGLPRPFRARNDIVKIYIAFVLLTHEEQTIKDKLSSFKVFLTLTLYNGPSSFS